MVDDEQIELALGSLVTRIYTSYEVMFRSGRRKADRKWQCVEPAKRDYYLTYSFVFRVSRMSISAIARLLLLFWDERLPKRGIMRREMGCRPGWWEAKLRDVDGSRLGNFLYFTLNSDLDHAESRNLCGLQLATQTSVRKVSSPDWWCDQHQLQSAVTNPEPIMGS